MATTRAYAALLLIPLSLFACGTSTAGERAVSSGLIPVPSSLQPGRGQLRFDRNTQIHAGSETAKRASTLFADLAQRSHGFSPAVDAGRTTTGIVFEIDPALRGDSDEAYEIDIDAKHAVVRARTAQGLQHGAVTLWQLAIDAHGPRSTLPAVRIADAPRFGWRGVMLDSARHFQTVDEIKHLIDAMVVHKLNVFHWHLTDDQGWRIEIKRYPKLTEVGGCRQPSGDAGIDADGKPVRYCGWYTQDQIREVVKYAAERHIQIVPEIDIPGHATAIIAAYPELGTTTEPLKPVAEWGVFVNLLNTEESTMVFMEHVFEELVSLFPGRYVHIGGDEAVKDQWIASPRVQAQMKALGLKTEMQMQSRMVARFEAFLAARGKRLIGWDEILEGELPPSATVMSWRGIEGGLQAAGKGHDVVMSPVSHLYLDYLQTESPNEPPGRPTTVTLRKLYDFDPVPDSLAADRHHHILGVQANAWTEHMRTYARVQHAMFPRLAALAEVGWSAEASRSYDDFIGRLPSQLARYRMLGIAPARTPFEVRFDANASDDGRASVALSNATGYPEIRYTTDGSEPKATSPRYDAPLSLAQTATVRAAVFVDDKPLQSADRYTITQASLLERTDETLKMCTGALMLRLEDDTTVAGERAIFNVDIFNPCWEWTQAPLSSTRAVALRVGRIPYYFQLAHDEKNRRFKPATTAHGEAVLRAGCDGPVLATTPLPAAPGKDGFLDLTLPLPAQTESKDLCVYFTGDTRPTMWVLDRIRLLPR
ncbi:beta-N-acetylhexosaminidase [Lysobacter brunescens]|uniref:beta-N-acetylhexosaminidase n=1 Tax=Lysobacter brunescens TaxID=262323 RepID=A0ABW2YCH4_9GAMM